MLVVGCVQVILCGYTRVKKSSGGPQMLPLGGPAPRIEGGGDFRGLKIFDDACVPVCSRSGTYSLIRQFMIIQILKVMQQFHYW